MKKNTQRLANLLSQPWLRLQRRFQQARPGSVLILVVALLVLLALMGTAYVSSARLERYSSITTNSQRMLREMADAFANQLIGQVKSSAGSDSGNVVTCPTSGATATSFLAASAPTLLPDLGVSGPSSQFPGTPVWPAVSRLAGYTTAESPYSPMGNTYQYNPNVGTYFAPTNIVIHYLQNSVLGTDPALVGQTRTFPAFMQYTPDPANPTQYLTPAAGPFLAGDATGAGIANTAMVRLTSSPVQGVTFFGNVYVVDNAAKINLNTAWTSQQDVEKITGNCFDFFPSDIDLLGAMNNTTSPNYGTPTEMNTLNAKRFQGTTANVPNMVSNDDLGTLHSDVTAATQSEAFWFQLGRRPGNPNGNQSFGNKVGGNWVRPFSDSDTAAVGWHGQLLDLDNPLALIDQQMSTLGNDSIYAGAANCVASASNHWRYFGANNVGYWYDWYWNFDNTQSSATGGVSFPIAAGTSLTSVSSQPFRSLRGLVVGANPVANICTQVPYTLLSAFFPAATTAIPVNCAGITNPGIHAHKASLNTGLFPELWAGFVNVMAGSYTNPTTGIVQFSIPGDPLFPPAFPSGLQNLDNKLVNQNQAMYRNVLRDVNSGSTVANKGANINGEPIKEINLKQPAANITINGLDSNSVMLLRAALAACNVQTLRNGAGLANVGGTPYFAPNVVRNCIALKTARGEPVQAVCYGVAPHPYITEVYANTDQSPHTDASGITTQNMNGLVVIKLYNPYPFPLSLRNYRYAIIDRRATGGSYPAMTFSLSTAFPVAPSIPAQGTYILTSYDGGPKNNYWPAYLGTPPTFATALELRRLTDVFFGANPVVGNPPTAGGEFVLLSPLGANGGSGGLTGSPAAEVPVDSYDFTGLQIQVGQTMAVNWHYLRTAGNLPANRWKCVYAGEYRALESATLSLSGLYSNPRFKGTDVTIEYDSTNPAKPDPWILTPPVLPFALTLADTTETKGSSTSFNTYNGIELCNVDFGGFYKNNGTPRAFPYGAFARVGDVVQAPYIGSYYILPPGFPAPLATVGLAPTKVMECNPVSIDATLVDDNDPFDDVFEHLGRFVPILNTATNYDDYSRTGYYGTNDPDSGNVLPANKNDPFSPHSKWRYHWTMGVLDQFTTVSNPESDYYPNVEPTAWNGILPSKVANTAGATPNNNNEFATEGLININSAPWRVLAAMEMIPKAYDPSGALNVQLAKAIVRYRDVDDLVPRTGNRPKQGHGPFKSVMELNKVAIPGTPNISFQTALGQLPLTATPGDPTYFTWGNYAPGPLFVNAGGPTDPNLKDKPLNDWTPQTLMVRRISNLVTLRSDSFTAYVIVQGWRNVGTNVPELVIQKRLAVIIDRSQLGNAGGSPATYTIPAD